MQHHDHFLELCTGYLLDSLDPAERREFEAHLRDGCSICESELRTLGEAFADLAELAPRKAAPSAVKARVLGEIRGASAEARSESRGLESETNMQSTSDDSGAPADSGAEDADRTDRMTPPSSSSSPSKVIEFKVPAWVKVAMPTLAAACLLLLVDGTRIRSDRDQLEGRLEIVRARITELEAERDEQAKWASLIESSEVQVAELGATGSDTPDGLSGWAVYEPTSRQAAVLLRNATPPAGSDFQLWAIDGDGPRNLGVVQLDANGQGTVRVDRVTGEADIAAIAVSLEPAGGSPNPNAPSGPVVLVGSLGD